MILKNDWQTILEKEIHQPYFKRLMDFVRESYDSDTCYPPKNQIFHSLELTSYEKTKVLILGQDPYHQEGQAMGLAFSVQEGIKIPPSLRNIYKELENDLGIPYPEHGNLTSWAKQGVLLMNAIWTVRDSKPLSHKGQGWERWTDTIIKYLNQKQTPMVFVLWGGFAKSKRQLITNPIHKVIENVHPSPLSAYRGFFGSKPFTKINQFLRQTNQSTIDFRI